jgi:L-aspartate oxidase
MKGQTPIIHTDILVIGSGIAGLTFALKAKQMNPEVSILILSKSTIELTNTRLAQGGIAVVSDLEKDSFEKHIQDTLKAGMYSSIPEVVEQVVRQAPTEINWLEELGIQFTKDETGKNELGLEGGHSEARIVHHQDQTGKAVQEKLLQHLKDAPQVKFESKRFVSELLLSEDKKQCIGAVSISIDSGEVNSILAKVTYIASGGCGQLFECTTNPSIATGDGIALAIQHQVKTENLAYIQFHPTSFYEPNKETSFLISEAVRGFGAFLINDLGERFVFKTDSRGELATRDIVSQSIYKEMRERPLSCVYLDLRHLSLLEFQKHFPAIHNFLTEKEICVSKDLIPVVPAAHYQCGGISVDQYGETSLSNLFAGGECAHTGLHGKNRLASNSLLEALVYADLSCRIVSQRIKGTENLQLNENQLTGQFTPDKALQIEIQRAIKSILTHQVISVSCPTFLRKSLRKLCYIQTFIEKEIAVKETNTRWLELRNMTLLGQQIVREKIQTSIHSTKKKNLTITRTILSE